MVGFIKKHKSKIIFLIVWCSAILSILVVNSATVSKKEKRMERMRLQISEYRDIFDSLPLEVKHKIGLYECGLIRLANNDFYLIGDWCSAKNIPASPEHAISYLEIKEVPDFSSLDMIRKYQTPLLSKIT